MFKIFLSPLSHIWEKSLKSYNLPSNLRSALLILFAMAIVQITMFGAALTALILLFRATR